MKFTILKYVSKSIRNNRVRVIVHVCMIALILFLPLFIIEYLENEIAIHVVSKSPLNTDEVDTVTNLQEVTDVVKVSYKLANQTAILRVDDNFVKFAGKFLIDGALPSANGELAMVITDKEYRLKKAEIGDELLLGDTTYVITGFLDPSSVPNIFEVLSRDVVLLEISKVSQVRALVIRVSGFADLKDLSSRISGLLGSEKTRIDIKAGPMTGWNRLLAMAALVLAALIQIVCMFLAVMDMREDSVILFSVGWTSSDVFMRILVEILILNTVGSILSVILLSYTIDLIYRYYFSLNPVFYIIAIFMLLGIGMTFLLSRVIVFKNMKEVLTG